jgi:hypothetical protein
VATKRMSMRAIREILRLRWEAGLSQRATAQSLGVSAAVVCACVKRARRAGLEWPLPGDLDDVALEARLYPPAESNRQRRVVPDWSYIHQEYRERYADSGELCYRYSRFCHHYRRWSRHVAVVRGARTAAGQGSCRRFSGLVFISPSPLRSVWP